MPTTTSTLTIQQGFPVARDAGFNPSRSSCPRSLSTFMPYGRQATSLLTIPSIPSFPLNVFEGISSPLSTLMPGRVCHSQRDRLTPVTHPISWLEAFELLSRDIIMMVPVIQAGTEYSWIGGNRLFLSSVPYQIRRQPL
ncbi:MAG: hypothetical protein KC592_03620 [Nitrospira sp.]|nr:hypothetical protein [Nitrospira sp.]